MSVNPVPPPANSSRAIILGAALVGAATIGAYLNSFRGAFVFDDGPAILANPTIKSLARPELWFQPPLHTTVSGRPLLNVSFAINQVISGDSVWSYHALNLAIHLGTALLLFGVIRRTLQQPVLREKFGEVAASLAAACAMLWAVHPLQTESVTYVVQRAESLGGLFFLLTLYGFIRGATTPGGQGWLFVSVGACLLGAATNEVIATAPLMVLLYDAVFVAEGFRAALRLRIRFYAGLAATWLVLGALIMSTNLRGGVAGFDPQMSWWHYALTQIRAIALYVRLVVWPRPLVLDYGADFTAVDPALFTDALLLAFLLGLTVTALWRRHPAGFAGAWFFLILAPTFAVMPIATQTMAEHRIYLSLAAPVALAVVALHPWLKKRAIYLWASLIVALAGATWARNTDYRSELALWTDTTAKRPENPRALNNLGSALLRAGRGAEAMARFAEAVQLRPADFKQRMNYANALFLQRRSSEALAEYEKVLQQTPDYPDAHFNLANALDDLGRLNDALGHYAEAIRLRPDYFEAHANYAVALLQAGRMAEAFTHYERTTQLRPNDPTTYFDLAVAYLETGNPRAAIPAFEHALEINPDYAEAQNNLASAYLDIGNVANGLSHAQSAVRLRPDDYQGHYTLGTALFESGNLAAAATEFETVLRLEPKHTEAREKLERLRSALAFPAR